MITRVRSNWSRYTPSASAVRVPQTRDYRFQTQTLLGEPYLFPQYFGRPAQVNAGNVKSTAGQVLDEGRVAIGAFELDKYPVTNAEFAAFLRSSNYTPADSINFLKHWHHPNASVAGAQRSGGDRLSVPAGARRKATPVHCCCDCKPRGSRRWHPSRCVVVPACVPAIVNMQGWRSSLWYGLGLKMPIGTARASAVGCQTSGSGHLPPRASIRSDG
jgi:hypothetical protein|eukprot:COSAG06_NODE_3244_length_5614_cov_3.709917_3_plen_216_part_00